MFGCFVEQVIAGFAETRPVTRATEKLGLFLAQIEPLIRYYPQLMSTLKVTIDDPIYGNCSYELDRTPKNEGSLEIKQSDYLGSGVFVPNAKNCKLVGLVIEAMRAEIVRKIVLR